MLKPDFATDGDLPVKLTFQAFTKIFQAFEISGKLEYSLKLKLFLVALILEVRSYHYNN